MYYSVISLNIGVVFLVLIVYSILQWSHIAVGSFLDWVIAVAIFEWLLVIVTVPWNIHFKAKGVIAEANQSKETGITIDEKQVKYAQKIAKLSLWSALALHLLSAIGLYTLAVTGISALGYISSGAALLLTFLRPAISTYEYLAMRLSMIQEQVKYPRQDVIELRYKLSDLESEVRYLKEKLNPDDPRSYVTTNQQEMTAMRNDLNRLASGIEQLKVINESEHENLSREARQAIAQLSEDGQFLDHVREIIRFFKTA